MTERIAWTRAPHIQRLRDNAEAPLARFVDFEQAVFADGQLSAKTKELIAVAVTHVTQCDACLQLHVKNARKLGATEAEIIEAVWVAAELRAGAAIGQLRSTFAAIDQVPPKA